MGCWTQSRRSLLLGGVAIGAGTVLSNLLDKSSARAQTPPLAASAMDKNFSALGQNYLDGLFALSPTLATAMGDHRFDSDLPDMSSRGREKLLSFYKGMDRRLSRIERHALNRDNQVDAALLTNDIASNIWQIEVERRWEWDPQIYQEVAGSALYTLAVRDFAPWDKRLKAAIDRIQKIPILLEQMRAELAPAKVPEIYATTVAKQNMGTLDIVESIMTPAASALSARDRMRFDGSVATLKSALAEHQKWLDDVLVPQARGDFRLDPALYDQKLAYAMVHSITRDEIKRRATKALEISRAEMYAIARNVLAGRADAPSTPPQPSATQRQAAIAAALELSYKRRPARDKLMDLARETLAEATSFVRAKALVTMPAAPVKVTQVPKYMQGVAVAYCDSPGPLDKALDTFYLVSPIPDEWSEEQTTSFLREYNYYMIHDLSIHEAMPGHYLQIAHANENKSILRAILSSGPFIEGWAVYAEGLMADEGYLIEDPLFKLTVLKMRLRSITNSLLDIGIHTEGLTRDEAMEMMMQGAFQQEREAAGKWVRAQLGAVQLLSYFTGYSEHLAIRAEAKSRWGDKFTLKTYHDAVLAHGSPPARFVKALMFNEPIG